MNHINIRENSNGRCEPEVQNGWWCMNQQYGPFLVYTCNAILSQINWLGSTVSGKSQKLFSLLRKVHHLFCFKLLKWHHKKAKLFPCSCSLCLAIELTWTSANTRNLRHKHGTSVSSIWHHYRNLVAMKYDSKKIVLRSDAAWCDFFRIPFSSFWYPIPHPN